MVAQNLGMRIGTILSSSARFENNVQFSEYYALRRKMWKYGALYVMSLTNPHTISGRPTIKDVERFRYGSFHEFCRLKALTTLKEVKSTRPSLK